MPAFAFYSVNSFGTGLVFYEFICEFSVELVDIGQYILSLALASGGQLKELIIMVIEFFLIVTIYASRQIKYVTCAFKI